MKPARIIVIAVAAVSAIGLALVVRSMGSSDGAPVAEAAAEPREMSRVLVATRDLNIGDRLTQADMDWREFPIEAVNAAWIIEGAGAIPEPAAGGDAAEGEAEQTPPPEAEGATAEVQRAAERLTGGGIREQVEGAVVRERILAGEPIVASKLVRAGQSGFMAVVLAPGMRAMAVPVSAETGAGGFILPGDRVDVIMSRRAESEVDGRSGFVTATVLRNVRVLAMGETTEAGDAQTVSASNATLEVGAREAELLAFADAQGDLYLVLRSYADTAEPSGAAIATSESPANDGHTVRVFRNGEATDVQVR